MADFNNPDSETTKGKIFLTAADLFATHGFDRVSIRQICEAVGVQKPTLYYYFKDKETLLLEMLKYTDQLVDSLFEQFIGSKTRFEDKLRGLIWGRKYFAETYPQFIRFHALMHWFTIPDRVKKLALQHFALLFEKVQTILKQGQEEGVVREDEDLTILAQTLMSMLNHLTARYFIFQEQEAFSEQNLERLWRFWQNHFFSNPSSGGKL